MLFASGMASATAVFRALCRPGDHVVAQQVMYFGLRAWLLRLAAQWDVKVDLVDATRTEEFARAVRPGKTRIVWVETPANPNWDVVDLAAVAQIAHGAGARLAVDSTCATPVHTRPIEHGADLVMHAATKYLNGHSDVLAGALVTARKDAAWEALRQYRHDDGACLGAFEAWLLLRGMRTLFPRVERQSANAFEYAPGGSIVLPPRDVDAWAQALLHLHDAPERIEGMGEAASADDVDSSARARRPRSRAGRMGSSARDVARRRRSWSSIARRRGAHTVSPPICSASRGHRGLEDLWRDLEQALGGV
jgi:cystathionine gamma-synthase